VKASHVFNSEHVAALESEDRKVWQNPEEILRAMEPKPQWVAADLGCCSGYFTIPLSKMVKKVYAIDVQQKMLNYLEDKIKKLEIKTIEPLSCARA
jgi:ubiquinone/menaquinone biosynthesis C-methylase UbiE